MTGDAPKVPRPRQRLAPIHYRQESGEWIFSRYADVAAALRDARFGFQRVTNGGAADSTHAVGLPAGRDKGSALHSAAARLMNLWLPARQAPDHGRLRAIVAGAFTAEAMARLRPRVQALTDEVIDRVKPSRRMDIVSDLAVPLPMTVIKDVFGFSSEELPQLGQWSVGLRRMIMAVTSRDVAHGVLAMAAFAQYFRKKAADSDGLGEGLFHTLVAAHRDGQLSEDELVGNATLLVFSGHHTTQDLIAGGALALLRHPDQRRLLCDQPDLLRSAIEETLRHQGPVQVLTRQAHEDVQLGDTRIRAGDMVRLCIGAANRDPEQFPEPDRFDIRRAPNPHLGFGAGMHHCLGMLLARLEAGVVLGTLLQRLPDFALGTTEPEWEEGALKSLPVVF